MPTFVDRRVERARAYLQLDYSINKGQHARTTKSAVNDRGARVDVLTAHGELLRGKVYVPLRAGKLVLQLDTPDASGQRMRFVLPEDIAQVQYVF